MRGLSAPKTLRPGLMLTGNLSRGEVYYWSREKTGREAGIHPRFRLGGWVITFFQDENLLHTIVVPTDGEAHDVAQEYVATGRKPGEWDSTTGAPVIRELPDPWNARTGEHSEIPGLYKTDCRHQEKRLIGRGKAFPYCGSCRHTVFWQLVRAIR